MTRPAPQRGAGRVRAGRGRARTRGAGEAGRRRALAILEELHDLGAEEVRSRLGAKPGPAVPSVC